MEEISCVDQYNERNQSKILENKSPLYIFGAQMKKSFGAQSIISSTRKTSISFYGSSKRSCNDIGLVPKFR